MRRLLGAALTVSVMLGGLLLVTVGPAAASTCVSSGTETGSDAQRAGNADAVFVGELVSRVDRTDQAALAELDELAREPKSRRSDRFDQLLGEVMGSSAVLTFEVSRVYKGAVGERQEIVTAAKFCGLELRGPGPFLVFAHKPSPATSRHYQIKPGQYVSGMGSARSLADGGGPALGGPVHWSSRVSLAVGVGVLAVGVAAGLGLAAFRARRRASAD
jgi:hypothetical protein